MDAPHLTEHFAQGRPWLVIGGEQVFIAQDDAIVTRTKGAGVAQFVLVNLEDLWNRLPLLVGNKTEFTRSDLAAASGTYADAVSSLIIAGLLGTPSGRTYRFTVLDLFAACLLGSLKRNGVSRVALLKVSRFIRDGQALEAAAG